MKLDRRFFTMDAKLKEYEANICDLENELAENHLADQTIPKKIETKSGDKYTDEMRRSVSLYAETSTSSTG